MPKKKTKAIDLSVLTEQERRVYDALSEEEKAQYWGLGKGSRSDADVPQYIATKEEKVIDHGNSFIVLGLDRPSNIFSGFGGVRDTHCAAIDIVAGRLGSRARRRDAKGKLINVDPNFKLDAARIYLSQRSNPDGNFGIPSGRVGSTHPESPRSTVVAKADTLRFIARENIKLITRTDVENSQGGENGNADTAGYGIDLMAMNDDSDLQPLVKGDNLVQCLTTTIEAIHDLRELFKNYLEYNRTITQALMKHTHRTPFYGQLTAPDFEGLLPQGSETLVNNLTNVESQLMLQMKKLDSVESNYLSTPAGAEATEDGKGLFILSKYNSTN